MNINLKFLLLGTSLSLIPNITYAQCAVTNCQQLGYTSLQKCDNGLKCPFGEYWACPCDASYKYICTGANESKGSDSCGGKYSACQCASGYNWNNGKCEPEGVTLGQCSGNAKNCKIGDILNTDGSCSNDKVSGKTPIGIVIYISQQNCGWAMTASPIAENIDWSTQRVATGIGTTENWEAAIRDFDACVNTQKIIQKGDASVYPAAWAAVNYTPSTAPVTKGKWCLPSPGMLSNLYMKRRIINNTISKLGGILIPLDNEDYNDPHIWSSSEHSSSQAWFFCTGLKYGDDWDGVNYYGKNTLGNGVVSPVIEF